MRLLALVEVKNYDVVCHELYNTFLNEPDLLLYSFALLDMLYPGHKDKYSEACEQAVEFILKEMRNYAREFQDFDINNYPELKVKLYDLIKHCITT